MKKIFIIRGAFLNPFELQNYYLLAKKNEVIAISSKHPISDKIQLPLKKLWSPTDLPNFPFKFPILNRLFTDAHRLYGLDKVIKGADIVHVAETYFGYTHQAIMAKRRGVVKRVISTVWEIIPHNNESLRGRKQYKKLAQESVDHFITVTEMAKEALLQEGVSDTKISVIPVGVDIKRFSPEPGLRKKRTFNILCVARLVPEKGIEDLVTAFFKIKEKYPQVHLTLIGDGPLGHDLAGFKNIHLKKNVPYGQIHTEYQKADLFCLPSRSTSTWQEQFGVSLVEAMASGLPIVTTSTGAIPEVCGEAALYGCERSPETLQTNLEKLIYNEVLRQKMAQIARARALAKFDHLKIAKQIQTLYQKVCR